MEPNLHRPFKAPLYPGSQAFALLIAVTALVSMFVFNPILGILYIGILTLALSTLRIRTRMEAS
jgi:ethanolamine permease